MPREDGKPSLISGQNLPGVNKRENPLSPFGTIPYTVIVCTVLWALSLAVSAKCPAPPLPVLWLSAALSTAWFLYKTVENFTMTYAPASWWTITNLKMRKRRRLRALTNNYRAIGITDLLDLFFAFFFMAGTIVYALETTLPGTYGTFPAGTSCIGKLVFLTTSVGFSGLGVGFVVVQPLTVLGSVVGFLLTVLFILVTITVLANASSLAQESHGYQE